MRFTKELALSLLAEVAEDESHHWVGEELFSRLLGIAVDEVSNHRKVEALGEGMVEDVGDAGASVQFGDGHILGFAIDRVRVAARELGQ